MNKEKLIPELRFPEFKNEGEWERKLFEDLFEIGNGRDYKHLDKGDIPVYGSGGYMLSVNDFLYDGESVCIGRKGTIDKPMFLNGKFWTVDTLFYTHSFKNCFPNYIHYLFQNIDWLKHNEAGGVPSLSKTNIYKIETAIPKLPEQQKIASCLSSLDEVIAAHSQKLELLKDHKKGLMQNLFPNSITNYESSITSTDDQFVIRNSQSRNLPKYRFKEFEKDGEWVEKKLGELGTFLGGGTPSRTNSEYWSGNIPWISSSDINDDDIHTISISQYINENSILESATKKIPIGSILFVSRVGVGKLAINKEELCTSQDFTSFIPTEILNYYVAYYFSANKNLLQALSQGTSIKGYSKSDLEDSKISYPKSPKEQQKIASCLSSLDALITAQAEKIEQLKLHKKGLMQGLFPKIES